MKSILLILLSVLALSGCVKESGGNPSDKDLVYFEIIPNVAEASASGELTRAKVDGAFGSDARIGLSISNTGANIHQMYKNFYARNNGTSWGYYLNGSYNGTMMAGFQSWGEITVMGYYPYNPAVTNVSAIPFSIAAMTGVDTAESDEETATMDYMVAGSKTKNMQAEPSTGEVTLEFDHLMSSISFYVQRSYQGPQIKLSKVKFEIDGSRAFGVEGTYSAKNPVMSDMESNLTINKTAKTLTVDYSSSSGTTIPYNSNFKDIPLLIMPPLKYTGSSPSEDATVTLTFYFTETDGSAYSFDDDKNAYTDAAGNPKLSFKLSEIINTGVSDKGFLAGHNYRVLANIGTYVRFTGAPVLVEKELDGNTNPQHIDI